MSQHNPSLTDLLRLVQASTELNIHCMMPGVVTAYDSGTGLATVQPSLNIKERKAPAAVPRAQVIAPVAFPTVGGFSIEYAPLPNDPCLLLFSDRGLDAWTQSGGVVDPAENARHAIKDAIVLPFAVSSNSTRQKRIEITPLGDVTIEGTTTIKLGNAAVGGVAKGINVDAFIATLYGVLSGFTPVPGDGGLALKTAFTTAFPTPPLTVQSTKVKAE